MLANGSELGWAHRAIVPNERIVSSEREPERKGPQRERDRGGAVVGEKLEVAARVEEADTGPRELRRHQEARHALGDQEDAADAEHEDFRRR